MLREIPGLKEELSVNVELASPGDFVPLPRDWHARSPFVERAGLLAFRHFDLYSQALPKLERGHAQDVGDVREMLDRALPGRRSGRFSPQRGSSPGVVC